MIKKSALLGIIVIAVVASISATVYFGGKTQQPQIVSPTEVPTVEAESEDDFNATHGYIYKVELGGYESNPGGYNPHTYDPETGEYYESWDFVYYVELLDGHTDVRFLRHRVSQDYNVGDFVEIGISNYEIWLFNLTTMKRIPIEGIY